MYYQSQHEILALLHRSSIVYTAACILCWPITYCKDTKLQLRPICPLDALLEICLRTDSAVGNLPLRTSCRTWSTSFTWCKYLEEARVFFARRLLIKNTRVHWIKECNHQKLFNRPDVVVIVETHRKTAASHFLFFVILALDVWVGRPSIFLAIS